MEYFEKPGRSNTERTLRLALARGKELGIRKIVVASTGGETAEKLLNCGFTVSVVTHQAGYKETGFQEFPEDTRAKLTDAGMKVLSTTHLFGGVDRALAFKFQGIYPGEFMASTLRMLGQGMKVAVEIATMAMDAGHFVAGEEIIAIGGSGRGADTAIVLTPAHSQYIFNTNIKEIICMPRGHRVEEK